MTHTKPDAAQIVEKLLLDSVGIGCGNVGALAPLAIN